MMVENCDFFFTLHLHSMLMFGGPRQNTGIRFGTEKLEWCGYSMVKKV